MVMINLKLYKFYTVCAIYGFPFTSAQNVHTCGYHQLAISFSLLCKMWYGNIKHFISQSWLLLVTMVH